MKKISLLAGILVLINCSVILAQIRPNNIFLEVGGNGFEYSLNYERLFIKRVAVRVGYGLVLGDRRDKAVVIPLMVNYITGNDGHYFELGGGCAYITKEIDYGFFDLKFKGIAATGFVGYRYQPENSGILFRVGITPFVGSGGFLPWAGMSLGYCF